VELTTAALHASLPFHRPKRQWRNRGQRWTRGPRRVGDPISGGLSSVHMKITAAMVPARSAPFNIETLDLAAPLAEEVIPSAGPRRRALSAEGSTGHQSLKSPGSKRVRPGVASYFRGPAQIAGAGP
jgi:hypothetical protein